MRLGRWLVILCSLPLAASGQVIEFESGGLKYLTQTRQGVTVMFAHLPTALREYSIIQVAVSNGSSRSWILRPEDFVFRRADGTQIQATPARAVVGQLMERGSRDDVIKLVSAYEQSLYGFSRHRSTSGYEQRRLAAMAEFGSTRLKAAAAASAIAFVQTKLPPGDSTDGAVFYPTHGKPLGVGWLVVQAGGTVFEFQTDSAAP